MVVPAQTGSDDPMGLDTGRRRWNQTMLAQDRRAVEGSKHDQRRRKQSTHHDQRQDAGG